MKSIFKLTLVIGFVFLTGCTSYQVFQTQTSNTKIEGEKYIYENDTLRIEYDFWKANGSLSFSIYNKLNKPVYIDWRKSSYVNNGIKLNYWEDTEITNSTGTTVGYLGKYRFSNINFYSSVNVNNSTKTKPERITFIPPKSTFIKNQFKILPVKYFPAKDFQEELISDIDKPERKVRVKAKNYSKNESPLIFRNFFTFSTSENFEKEFYLDNEFYISKVIELKGAQFQKIKIRNNKRITISPFKDSRSFYLMKKQ